MVSYFREVSSTKGKSLPRLLYEQGASATSAWAAGLTAGRPYAILEKRHLKEIAERLGVKEVFIMHELDKPDFIEINFGEVPLTTEYVGNLPQYKFLEGRFEALRRELNGHGATVVYNSNEFFEAIKRKPWEQTYVVRVSDTSSCTRHGIERLPSLIIYARTDSGYDEIIVRADHVGEDGVKGIPSGLLSVNEGVLNNPNVAHALDLVVQHLFEKGINLPKLETIE